MGARKRGRDGRGAGGYFFMGDGIGGGGREWHAMLFCCDCDCALLPLSLMPDCFVLATLGVLSRLSAVDRPCYSPPQQEVDRDNLACYCRRRSGPCARPPQFSPLQEFVRCQRTIIPHRERSNEPAGYPTQHCLFRVWPFLAVRCLTFVACLTMNDDWLGPVRRSAIIPRDEDGLALQISFVLSV